MAPKRELESSRSAFLPEVQEPHPPMVLACARGPEKQHPSGKRPEARRLWRAMV